MKDGYYLTIYSSVGSLCNLLHTSHRHDHNLSLWLKTGSEVQLVHHWELERITGIKHHSVAFFSEDDAKKFIGRLLSAYDLTLEDIVEIWGTPSLDTISNYQITPYKKFTYHALCHLFSSILLDSDIFFNESILALSYDSGSDILLDNNTRERAMYVWAYSHKGKIEIIEPMFSPAIYWSTLRKKYGYEEGTLMALAYASKSQSLEAEELTKCLENAYSDKDRPNVSKLIDDLDERVKTYGPKDIGQKFNFYDRRFSLRENQISMVMKIVQEFSIREVAHFVENILDRNNINPTKCYLALSGGFALNCPTNSHLMSKFKFKGLLVPPCVNDGGQAIGMGLLNFYKELNKFTFHLGNSYYGNKDKSDLDKLLKTEFSKYIDSIEYGIDSICEDIVRAPVVWVEGRAEIGPRALGHRSILADSRWIKAKDKINEIKGRQWWRPVAPIILKECMEDWFENGQESPYMLRNFSAKRDKEKLIEAVLHLDNTARVQTVSEKDGLIYQVLQMFYQQTGIPILCNTSLNDKGEPIIDSAYQALIFALRKKIKVIYINGWRVSLCNVHSFNDKGPALRDEALFNSYYEDPLIMSEVNPYNITEKEFFFSIINYDKNFDFQDEDQVKRMRRLRKIYLKTIPNYEKTYEEY